MPAPLLTLLDVDRVPGPFLVAQERLPRTLGVDRRRLRVELALDGRGVPARESQRREEPERDGLAVGQVEVRGGLEGMGEGVPEVEVPARAVVVRIAETESGLEGGCAASVERGAREELRLDELGLPLSPLAVRQRLEERLVEHDTRGPVEGADEVLSLGD